MHENVNRDGGGGGFLGGCKQVKCDTNQWWIQGRGGGGGGGGVPPSKM